MSNTRNQSLNLKQNKEQSRTHCYLNELKLGAPPKPPRNLPLSMGQIISYVPVEGQPIDDKRHTFLLQLTVQANINVPDSLLASKRRMLLLAQVGRECFVQARGEGELHHLRSKTSYSQCRFHEYIVYPDMLKLEEYEECLQLITDAINSADKLARVSGHESGNCLSLKCSTFNFPNSGDVVICRPIMKDHWYFALWKVSGTTIHKAISH